MQGLSNKRRASEVKSIDSNLRAVCLCLYTFLRAGSRLERKHSNWYNPSFYLSTIRSYDRIIFVWYSLSCYKKYMAAIISLFFCLARIKKVRV